MYNLTNTDTKDKTISSVEIARMMNVSHKNILQKLEGSDRNGKHTEGIIETLSRLNFQPSDFFIKSNYTNERGKTYTCYDCTHKGCEFLAHKFSGEKGILFTAQYIDRFHEMENYIINSQGRETKRIHDFAPIKLSDKRISIMNKVEDVAYERKTTPRKIMARVMDFLGEHFNVELARRLYVKKYGFEPPIALDLIEEHEEMFEMMSGFLDTMMKNRRYNQYYSIDDDDDVFSWRY